MSFFPYKQARKLTQSNYKHGFMESSKAVHFKKLLEYITCNFYGLVNLNKICGFRSA